MKLSLNVFSVLFSPQKVMKVIFCWTIWVWWNEARQCDTSGGQSRLCGYAPSIPSRGISERCMSSLVALIISRLLWNVCLFCTHAHLQIDLSSIDSVPQINQLSPHNYKGDIFNLLPVAMYNMLKHCSRGSKLSSKGGQI